MKNILYRSLLMLGAVALLFTSSCSKKSDNYGSNPSANNDPVISNIKSIVNGLPHFKAVNSMGINKKDADGGMTTQSGWDFSSPGGGYHYSSPNGVSYASSSNTFTIAKSGGGNAGGTVVAGSSSLDINYTFCFSIDDSVSGLSAFVNAASVNIAGVIGISGDFSKLSGSAKDFSDVFHGLAYYIVFSDGPASGSYDVIDWNASNTQSNLSNTSKNSPLHNKCFALVVDFKGGGMYLSKTGKINVKGGTMNFNGNYYAVTGFKVDSNGNYDLSKVTYSEVPGFGAMGCN